jgi:hypothetical protein
MLAAFRDLAMSRSMALDVQGMWMFFDANLANVAMNLA